MKYRKIDADAVTITMGLSCNKCSVTIYVQTNWFQATNQTHQTVVRFFDDMTAILSLGSSGEWRINIRDSRESRADSRIKWSKCAVLSNWLAGGWVGRYRRYCSTGKLGESHESYHMAMLWDFAIRLEVSELRKEDFCNHVPSLSLRSVCYQGYQRRRMQLLKQVRFSLSHHLFM